MDVQQLCEKGQNFLLATKYIAAEQTLVWADHQARLAEDFDALSRLYMPLQEARRQKRQRAGEGTVKLDLLLNSDAPLDAQAAEKIVDRYPHGQLLIAAEGSIAPAVRVREIAWDRALYLDVFLAAWYDVNGQRVVAVVPQVNVAVPKAGDYQADDLLRRLPPHSVVLPAGELLAEQPGTPDTFAYTMSLWERLHSPFLAAADASGPLAIKAQGYRQTIAVDYAAEKAHQRLSGVYRQLCRERRR